MKTLTEKQVSRLAQMVDKGYPIFSVRYNHLDKRVTVSVSVRRGTRYFFIEPDGKVR